MLSPYPLPNIIEARDRVQKGDRCFCPRVYSREPVWPFQGRWSKGDGAVFEKNRRVAPALWGLLALPGARTPSLGQGACLLQINYHAQTRRSHLPDTTRAGAVDGLRRSRSEGWSAGGAGDRVVTDGLCPTSSPLA
ncbi:hypothetical protein VTN96DRAFT_6314 [Rasamsonia emersonii]